MRALKSAADQALRLFRQHPLVAVFVSTYFRLRVGLVLVAFGLPLYLWLGGEWLHDVELQPSLSEYYTQGDLRDEFVAAICAVGVMLLLYRGFTVLEHWALNVAGIGAIGVALVPTGTSDLHGWFAVTFFVAAGYVALVRSRDTLPLIENERMRGVLQTVYVLLSIGMIVFVGIAVLVARGSDPEHLIFWMETSGVLAFGTYWLVKTLELRQSNIDRRLASGEVEIAEAGWREVYRPVALGTPEELRQRAQRDASQPAASSASTGS